MQQVSLQERSLQEAEERAREQLSQHLQAKTEIIQRQAGEATQVVVQAQSAVQAASATMTEYEAKMSMMSQTLAQLQQLIIDERKKRIDMESQLSAAQDKIGGTERQRNQLATKNQALESELTNWIAASNRRTTEQMMQPSVASVTQAMASSSGIVQQVSSSPLQRPQPYRLP